MKVIKPYLLFLIVFFIWGCSVSKEKYIKEYKKKSFVQSADNGLHTISMKYISKEIRCISSLKKKVLNAVEVQEILDEKSSELEFLLNLSVNNFFDEFLKYESIDYTYEEKVEYYSFSFRKDIEVYLDEVKSNINSLIFERNFGLTPKGTFTLRLLVPEDTEKIKFKLFDKVNNSEVQILEFDNKEIQSLPKLKKVKRWQN